MKKGEAEDNMRETKSKRVSVEKDVRSLKDEDLLLDSGTDSDYDGDSLSGSLNSVDFDSDIFDDEDGERESSDGHEGSDDDGDESELVDGDEDGSDEESDEVAPRNTIGNVPLGWYKDEKHIGYDINGKFDKPEEEPNVQLLWADDSTSDRKSNHLTYIPPPKGHEESYNPFLEYIPTEEEKALYEFMYEEDRPKFITKFIPRVRKKRINIDHESLKPKLPSRKDLQPYPNSCYLEYKGHTGKVTTISTQNSGQWIASGSTDGSVRIWEVETCRCLKIWQFDEAINCVAWSPLSTFSVLAVAMGRDLVILNTELGTDEEQKNIKELLHIKNVPEPKPSAIASWLPDEKYGGIMIRHLKNISSIDWHRKGDYLSTVMASGETRRVVIHKISEKLSQKPPNKLRGLAETAVFHPSRPFLFIATRKKVRVYNLLKVNEPVKKLETGMREISSMVIHPGGDNLIVGSKEGKMCWFDMDLSSKPYKILKNHSKDITNVAFHHSYPLFASSSEDSTAYVFHGKVYNDLNENPLIVPLEILRGHSTCLNGGGILDCKFHPRQPWLFTAGADSIIKLYCH